MRIHTFKISWRLFRYTLVEAVPFVLLTLLILTALILAQQVARQSDLLFSSTASFLISLRIILSLLPSVLVITLPFSLLIGSLMALNRLSSDSEIIAAQASGISLLRLSSPLLFCGLLGTGVSAYLTLQVIPKVLTDAKSVRRDLLLRALTAPLKAQTFDSHFPNHLIYIREIEKESGDWLGVFIVRKTAESDSDWIVLTAKRARLRMTQVLPVALELDLKDGLLVTMSENKPQKQALVRFSQQEIRLSAETPAIAQSLDRDRSTQELSLHQLLEKGQKAETLQERLLARVEWHKRLSLPVACLILILLAIPLGTSTTRQAGRAIAFTMGFCLAILYYLILLAGQNFALSGVLPAWLGIWLPNLIGAVGALSLNLSPGSWLTAPTGLAISPKSIIASRQKRLLNDPRIALSNRFTLSLSTLFSSLINYLLFSEFAKYLTLAALTLLLTSLIFTLFDLLPSLNRSGLGWSYAGVYLAYLAPQILYYVTPFALLLAILTSHRTLSRSNQLTALLVCGQSYLRLSLPFLFGATITITGLFWLSEQVLPLTNREQDARYNQIKGKKIEQAILALGEQWAQGEDGTIYAYHFNTQSNTLLNTTAYHLSRRTGNLEKIVYAAETKPINDTTWALARGWQMELTPANQEAEETKEIEVEFQPINANQNFLLTVPDTNALFSRIVNEASKMKFYELRQHIYSLSRLNAPTTSLRVDLEKKVAFPFSCIPLLALAFPLALKNTKGKTLAGIGLSIVIGFTYWISASLFESLGRQAFLPPGLSVWGPVALFTALGIFLSFRLRR